jgi:hypothetical protein
LRDVVSSFGRNAVFEALPLANAAEALFELRRMTLPHPVSHPSEVSRKRHQAIHDHLIGLRLGITF